MTLSPHLPIWLSGGCSSQDYVEDCEDRWVGRFSWYTWVRAHRMNRNVRMTEKGATLFNSNLTSMCKWQQLLWGKNSSGTKPTTPDEVARSRHNKELIDINFMYYKHPVSPLRSAYIATCPSSRQKKSKCKWHKQCKFRCWRMEAIKKLRWMCLQ